jgi:hypothetical protein
MKRILFAFSIVFFALNTFAQKPEETEDWSRKPEMVTPGKNGSPPSDAIVLYGGVQDTAKWEDLRGRPIKWIANDSLTCVPRSSSIKTRQSFGDCQLHIEWRTPTPAVGQGQDRGNSGVYLDSLYEVQVLDSWENETYYNGQAGAIYKQYIPLVNASTPPGTWQTYDIIFTGPRFNTDKTVARPGYITVFHNGVLIQNHVQLRGPTEYIGLPVYKYHKNKMPLMLQNHAHPVSYRNIWIREL